MRPGMWTTSAPGAVEDMILGPDVVVAEGNARVTFTPLTGYGDRNFIIYIAGRRVGEVFAAEGLACEFICPAPPDLTKLNVHIEDGGDWDTPYYDPWFTARELEEGVSNRIHFTWTARWTIHERGDALNQLSGWDVAGLKRFQNVAAVDRRPQWGRLGVALADAAGVRTVTLYSGAVAVASGSRVGDGVITLAEVDSSGVSGSVTVAYSADAALGTIYLDCRWPASYQIHYSASALSFPRTPEMTLDDDGISNKFTTASEALAAGTYNCALLGVSDTGDVDAATTATDTVTLAGAPEPPTNLAYASGTIAGTNVSWTASATAGVTYNVYDSNIGEPADTDVPVASGLTGTNYTLPDKTGQQPGVRRVVVRAQKSGVEEKNGVILQIEYDAAGARVAPRPNSPAIQSYAVTAGRTLTVAGRYDSSEELGTATQLQLFLWALGASADYTTPDDAEALSVKSGTIAGATLEVIAPANGFYWFGLRAATAAGVQDKNVNALLVWLGDDDPADVADFDAWPGGT